MTENRARRVRGCYERAQLALMRLDRQGVVREAGLLREEVGSRPPRDLAPYLLRSLRMELFIRGHMDVELGDAGAVVEEIAHLADAEDGDKPLAPQVTTALVRAQLAIFEERYDEATPYLLSAVKRFSTEQRIRELGARASLGLADKVEAAILVDAYAELARQLQRVQAAHGPMSAQRTQLAATVLHDPALESLLGHEDLGRWSERRTLSRLAYEAIERGDRTLGRRLLSAADEALPLELAHTPLGLLERPVIDLYREFSKPEAEYDSVRAAEILASAARNFENCGFHRRANDLQVEQKLLAGWGGQRPRPVSAV